MKRMVVFALVLNAALLGVIVHQLVAIASSGPEATQNGDTNGDGGRDISDAVYLLQWLFSNGEPPVAIAQTGDHDFLVDEADDELRNDLRALRAEMEDLQAETTASFAEAGAQRSALGHELAHIVQQRSGIGNLAMHQTDLSGVGLAYRDLKEANFEESILENADLRGAELSGANLRGVNLRGANLRQATLIELMIVVAAVGDDAQLVEEERVIVACDLGDSDCTGADFVSADLAGVNLSGADLSQADLRLANLMDADLTGADLTGADLRGSVTDVNGDGAPDLILGGSESEGIGVDIRVGGADCTGIIILDGGGNGCLQGVGGDLNGDGTVDVYTIDVAEARAAIAAAQTEPAAPAGEGGEGGDRAVGEDRLAEECVDGVVGLEDVMTVLMGELSEMSSWTIQRWHIENF